MKSYIMLIALMAACMISFTLFGYVYTSWLLDRQISRCGAYPTLNEAIQAGFQHNGFDPSWFELQSKAQNSDRIPWTWYIIYSVRPEYTRALEQAPIPEYYCGGSFYHHTRQGWVGMPEGFWNGLGFMDENMRLFHLYSEEP